MPLATALPLYGLTLVAFLVIDLVWIGVVAQGFYQKHLGFLLAPDVRWGAAALFYLLFVAALLVFAVAPGLARESLRHAVLLGAFLGLVCYATYDLTSLALTAGFPTVVAVVDLAWGTFLGGSVAGLGWAIGRWLGA